MADNTITIIGNLTRDPELRFTQAGKSVTSFGLAVNRRYMVNNEWKDAETQFFNVTVWGQPGENLAASCSKGDRLVVLGRIEFRKYENKEGQTVTTHDIAADEVAVSMRYATAQVERTKRNTDEASSAPPRNQQPAHGRPTDPIYGDEEPF